MLHRALSADSDWSNGETLPIRGVTLLGYIICDIKPDFIHLFLFLPLFAFYLTSKFREGRWR